MCRYSIDFDNSNLAVVSEGAGPAVLFTLVISQHYSLVCLFALSFPIPSLVGPPALCEMLGDIVFS